MLGQISTLCVLLLAVYLAPQCLKQKLLFGATVLNAFHVTTYLESTSQKLNKNQKSQALVRGRYAWYHDILVPNSIYTTN